MWRALIGSLLLSLAGLKLVYDGFKRDLPDVLCRLGIPAWALVAAGLVCQVPLWIHLYAVYLSCQLSAGS